MEGTTRAVLPGVQSSDLEPKRPDDAPPILHFTPTPPASDPARPAADSKRIRKALEAVGKEEERQARWQANVFTKRSELEDLERRIGEEIVAAADDQADAVALRLSRQVTALRDELESAERASAACPPKVVAARREVLRAELEDLREQLTAAARAKQEHDAKLRKLLDAVEAHDNAEYVPFEPARASAGVLVDGPSSWKVSTSKALGSDVAHLQLLVEIAEAVADGQRPPSHVGGVQIDRSLLSVRALEYFPELLQGAS